MSKNCASSRTHVPLTAFDHQMTVPVSIVIPVHNGREFLARSIDSALAQTHRNIEVIVVNDGSDDGGATDEIARQDGERITYLTQAHRGVAAAINNALEHITGRFFCWLDQDDEHLPDKTTSQVKFYL